MKHVLIVAALLLAARCAAAEEPPLDQVRAWIADLDSDNYERREAATARLMEVGSEGERLLREAERGATPEAQSRIRRALDILSWGLPAPYRARFEPVLAGYSAAAPDRRIEILGEAFSEWQENGTVGLHLLAGAYAREGEGQVREFLLGRMREHPGALSLAATHLLRASAGAAGVARVAELAEAALSLGTTREELLPVAGAVCVALERAGLGDLATPGLAMDMLIERSLAHAATQAATIFQERGMDREELLALRRAVLLQPNWMQERDRLDELTGKIGCGPAHLALLRWISTDDLAESIRPEIEARIKRWTDLVAGAQGPAVDLSACLRVLHWTPVPLTRHVLVGRRAVYVAGSHPQRVQSAEVVAHDRRTGELLWTYSPSPDPNTEIEMARDLGGSLREIGAGLIVLYEVTSELGGGGSLVHTASRTRVTLLSNEGRVVWSREYDLDPGIGPVFLDDAYGIFVPADHQHRGRAWGLRLQDGQIVSTMPISSRVFPAPGGRILTEGPWSWGMSLVDVASGRSLWADGRIDVNLHIDDPRFFVQGEAVYVTTGRHMARLRAKDGACEWLHPFDPDETTVAPAARDGEAMVVLDTGGKTWTVVSLDPATGDERSRRELPSGEDRYPSGRPPVAWEACRWVAPDVFMLRGRLVDLAAGLVVSREVLLGLEQRGFSDEEAWGLRVSEGADPVVSVVRGGLIAEVDPRPRFIEADKVIEAIEGARKEKPAAAEAMESLLRDWDPSALPGREGQDGK